MPDIVKLKIESITTNNHIVEIEADSKYDGMSSYDLIKLYKNKLLKELINEMNVVAIFDNGLTETWELADGTRD